MNLVLDTGIAIAFANSEKDKSLESIEKIFELTKTRRLRVFISSITVSEIYAFFHRRREPKKAVEICALLEEIGVTTINLDKELAKKGGIFKSKYAMSFADAIILATCADLKAYLITYDKEFNPVEDASILKPEEFMNAMKCSCGEMMKEVYKEISGIRTKINVCAKCGKELIDINEAIMAQKKIRKGKND